MNHLEKKDAIAQKLIARWHGGRGEIAEYSASLRNLAIRIYSEGKPGFLDIGCPDCKYLSGPMYWFDSHIQFVRSTSESGDFLYHLWDLQARLVIICGVLEVNQHQ